MVRTDFINVMTGGGAIRDQTGTLAASTCKTSVQSVKNSSAIKACLPHCVYVLHGHRAIKRVPLIPLDRKAGSSETQLFAYKQLKSHISIIWPLLNSHIEFACNFPNLFYFYLAFYSVSEYSHFLQINIGL